MLSGVNMRRVLVEWNDTRTEYPRNKPIHELFEERAAQAPDAVAVRFGAETLTYRDLNERANRIAHYIHQLGGGHETLIGLCVERSLEMVVGLLGILKSGAAYFPLDPDYPRDRQALMLNDTA